MCTGQLAARRLLAAGLAAWAALAGGCAPGTAATPAGLGAALPAATATPAGPITMRVLIAGSLMAPFDALEKAYESEHPKINVEMEAHGSIQVIRHVAELHELADLVVSADYALIPMLMYASTAPETGRPYANSYVRFATNALGLAHSPTSKYANEINAGNWYRIISRTDVKVGIADPRFDAAGYRALMALQLAEGYYGKATIFEDVVMGQFKTAITTSDENGRTTIHVPEIVETKTGSNIVVRGSSIQLIALLESGDLDYAFEYESVIRQHRLGLTRLPDEINLGAAAQADRYGTVRVAMDFRRFLSVNPEFEGEVIGYGLTIPSNAPHPVQAADLAAFLLGEKGRAIMEANHHPMIVPPVADNLNSLPAELRALCAPAR